jgi:hypothetical protein
MNKKINYLGAVGAAFAVSVAWAAQTSNIQGTITGIRLASPNVAATPTVVFALSSKPATSCKDNSNFAISAETDAQLLNNYLAMLLEARAAGQQVTVEFDAAVCDSLGYPRVTDIVVM